MKVSTRGRYALRLCIDVALQNRELYTSLKAISERQCISIKYLEQIIPLLSKAGLLVSSRGPAGGYKLARDPETITVFEILKAGEGSLSSVSCLEPDENPCPRQHTCPSLEIWQGLDNAIETYLRSVSLADVMRKDRVNTALDYAI
ncbi:MAG TPA: Rrf2 family transcriptional regulator [Treponemataceae bacterium]|jgi:Rrf2 family protein|nr:Rrf2 family transcriptional regulator [Treponemataceae bacterium]